MLNYKVEMVAAGGEEAGCLCRAAESPEAAMAKAEHDYPHLAAYRAEPLAAFDYSTVGGMMAAPRSAKRQEVKHRSDMRRLLALYRERPVEL